ncbi:hypothetical protein M673_13570 [Aureimonas sp. AU20]|nr:hypothetical protein M673_13570 [Aureimonas sp. AU20]
MPIMRHPAASADSAAPGLKHERRSEKTRFAAHASIDPAYRAGYD